LTSSLLLRAILHDEKTYPDPFTFKPERFMKNGKVVFDEKVIISAFGFGRRCGRYKYKFTGY